MERMLIWLGVALMAMGLLAAGLGVLLGAIGRTGGRLLPGDIVIQRPGFTLVFPIVTSLVLSVVLSVVLWIVTLIRR